MALKTLGYTMLLLTIVLAKSSTATYIWIQNPHPNVLAQGQAPVQMSVQRPQISNIISAGSIYPQRALHVALNSRTYASNGRASMPDIAGISVISSDDIGSTRTRIGMVDEASIHINEQDTTPDQLINFTSPVVQTIDRVMQDALGVDIFESTSIGAPRGTVIVEGDIIWSIPKFAAIQRELREQRNRPLNRPPKPNPDVAVQLWPGGVVPIRISSGGFTRGQKRRMQKAMNHISRASCVCFRIITRPQANTGIPHIRIRNRNRCASFIGRSVRRSRKQIYQDLLMDPKCRTTRIFTHELLHSLGFFHEHTLPTRNRNLRIYYRNIHRPNWIHFNRIPWVRFSSAARSLPYDYFSLMHYGNRAFSKNGRITIYPRQNPKRMLRKIGRSTRMSVKDELLLNKMYKCPKERPSRPNCPGYPYRFP